MSESEKFSKNVSVEKLQEIVSKDPIGFEKAKCSELEGHIIRAYKDLTGVDIESKFPEFRQVPHTVEAMTEFVKNNHLTLLEDYDLIRGALKKYASQNQYEIEGL